MPVDVFLAVGSAAVCYAIASAFCRIGRGFAFALGFSLGRSCDLLLAHAQLPCLRSRGVLYSAHSVCEGRSAGSRSQMLAVCFQPSLHTTPHPFITHHTTQYPHTSYTTNHAYQPFSLPPTTTHSCPHKFGMVYSLLYASDALPVLDQVYPIFPKL